MAGSKTRLVSPEAALPGRGTPIPFAERHAVLGTALKAPLSNSQQEALFGCGCFWGAGGAVRAAAGFAQVLLVVGLREIEGLAAGPVSYTHLTLPTNREV